MAIGSASVQSISRSGGRSATAAAAYRTGTQITDERTGQVHDYTRKGGVVGVAMYLPNGAPAMTTAELWNQAEAAENRKNSQVARELLVALPHELTDAQRRELVDGIAGALVERYGVAAEAAIHRPGREGDERNHHAHIMFTTRRMDAAGRLGEKTRELDVKPRSSAEVTWIRGMVEERTNQALARAGVDARIDMRSLAAQGIDAPKPVHEGPAVTAMRRRGAPSNVVQLSDYARQVRSDRAELCRIEAQIIDLEQARAARAAAPAPSERDQVMAEAVKQARIEHREQHHQVVRARYVLHTAKGDREYAAERLAKGLPEAQAKALHAQQQEAGHAAKAVRLERDADTWLEQHRIRAAIGSTGPADELRAKAKHHADQARAWAEAAKAAEQEAARLRHADSEAAKALALAEHSVKAVEAKVEREFDQGMEPYAVSIRAGREYDAKHRPRQQLQEGPQQAEKQRQGGTPLAGLLSNQQRLLDGIQRIQQARWYEYERDGERYRRDTPEPDKALRVQWLHDGTGQWHEQPREVIQEHAQGRGQGRDPEPPRHRPRGMGGR